MHSPRRGCEPDVVPAHSLRRHHRREGDEGFHTPGAALLVAAHRGRQPWTLTRPALVLLISVGLLAWFFVTCRKLSVVPTKRQFMAEQAYSFVRNTIARDIIGTKDFLQFLPLLFTLFTLILFNNVFGIVPLVQFPTMSRVGIPIVLTLIVYVVYHTVAIRRKHGVLPYLKSLIPPGCPVAQPILFVLEFLTYFVIRPLTLALRLFGNMLAGHLMLLVFILGGEYLLLHGDNLFLNALRAPRPRLRDRDDLLRAPHRVPAGVHLHPARSALHLRRCVRAPLTAGSARPSTDQLNTEHPRDTGNGPGAIERKRHDWDIPTSATASPRSAPASVSV